MEMTLDVTYTPIALLKKDSHIDSSSHDHVECFHMWKHDIACSKLHLFSDLSARLDLTAFFSINYDAPKSNLTRLFREFNRS